MSLTDDIARFFTEETIHELPDQLRLHEKQALFGAGFLQQVRLTAEAGVSYDWMLKVIEWERQKK